MQHCSLHTRGQLGPTLGSQTHKCLLTGEFLHSPTWWADLASAVATLRQACGEEGGLLSLPHTGTLSTDSTDGPVGPLPLKTTALSPGSLSNLVNVYNK